MTKRLGILSASLLSIAACGSPEAAPAEETAMPAEPTQGAEAAPAAEAAPVAAAPAEAAPATPAAQPAEAKMPEPTGGMLVIANVKDFDAWKAKFDEGASIRKDAGFLAHGVSRVVDNPRGVMVWLPTTDKDKAHAYSEDKELKKRMKESGVIGLPRISLVSIVENQQSHDPAAKFGAVVQHRVKDYDAWKPVFDEHASIRTGASIVGHAVTQDVANPHMVTVWVQATDLEKLKGFFASKDLKGAMKKAGVRGAPTITIVETTEFKSYQ